MGKKNEAVGNGTARSEETKLLVRNYQGRKYMAVELPWRASIGVVGRQAQFHDSVLALAELPAMGELRKIMVASQQFGIPSIWRRARPSVLEDSAAALLTALAFSGRRKWVPLVGQFFKNFGLKGGLLGRPRLDRAEMTYILRGREIVSLMGDLQEGFAIAAKSRRKKGYESGNEFITRSLKKAGYDQTEIAAILSAETLQDAAIRLFQAKDSVSRSLRTLRTSFSKYNRHIQTLTPA